MEFLSLGDALETTAQHHHVAASLLYQRPDIIDSVLVASTGKQSSYMGNNYQSIVQYQQPSSCNVVSTN